MRPSRLVPPAAVVLALALPSGAAAHLRSGTVAVGYQATVAAVDPDALRARVYESDRAIGLTVRRGHSVVVLGYLGEPFLRLDDAGVSVDAASPTAVAVGLVARGTRRTWQLRPRRDSVVWHDARLQGLPPGVSRGRWGVPLLVDGRRTELRGTIRRLPAPLLWPWGAAAAIAAVAVALLAARRPAALRRCSLALGAVAGAAACLTAVVFALDAYASPGTWIAGVDELVFAVVGFGALRWGQGDVRLYAAVGLGLLAVAVGASKGAVFLDAGVLAVVPGTVTRSLVAVSLCGGAAAAGLGGLVLAGVRGSARTIAQPAP